MQTRSAVQQPAVPHQGTGARRTGGVAPVVVQKSSDEVLTRQQVAEWLKVRPRQLDRMGVPCLDLGHKTKRYFKQDVQAWLDDKRSSNTAA